MPATAAEQAPSSPPTSACCARCGRWSGRRRGLDDLACSTVGRRATSAGGPGAGPAWMVLRRCSARRGWSQLRHGNSRSVSGSTRSERPACSRRRMRGVHRSSCGPSFAICSSCGSIFPSTYQRDGPADPLGERHRPRAPTFAAAPPFKPHPEERRRVRRDSPMTRDRVELTLPRSCEDAAGPLRVRRPAGRFGRTISPTGRGIVARALDRPPPLRRERLAEEDERLRPVDLAAAERERAADERPERRTRARAATSARRSAPSRAEVDLALGLELWDGVRADHAGDSTAAHSHCAAMPVLERGLGAQPRSAPPCVTSAFVRRTSPAPQPSARRRALRPAIRSRARSPRSSSPPRRRRRCRPRPPRPRSMAAIVAATASAT